MGGSAGRAREFAMRKDCSNRVEGLQRLSPVKASGCWRIGQGTGGGDSRAIGGALQTGA